MKSPKDIYFQGYRKYLKDPLTPYNVKFMMYVIKKFGHIASEWTYDLYEEFLFRQNDIKKTKKIMIDNPFKYNYELQTSGSTNFSVPKSYLYGPNPQILINNIWKFYHRFYPQTSNKFWIDYIKGKEKEGEVEGVIYNEGRFINLNRDKIPQSLLDIKGKMIWVINPSNLNYFLKYDKIIDFLKKSVSVVSITEESHLYYDFSILDKNKIPWTNQMRSWKEGSGFYSCPYKKIHFTENLFFVNKDKKIIDLFNYLNDWYDQDGSNPDEIWPLEDKFKECECGTIYRDFHFNPHAIKWFYNKDGNPLPYYRINNKVYKINCIKGCKFFQIIQKQDLNIFHIHSDINFSKEEIEEIKDFILKIYNSNFDIFFFNFEYIIKNSRKKPTFWSEYNYQKKQKMNGIFTRV